jgi:3-oxoacyl-[acyl-carrier protein] reductase
MNLDNKVAIVTGGASGLGASITRALIDKNANVVVLDIDQDALENLEDNERLLKIQFDITQKEKLSSVISLIIEKFSKIDILVNNAGILYSEPLINIMATEKRHGIENWQKVIDLNLTTPFILTSYVAEQMILKRTKGVIINISSISAKGNAGQSAYSAAKAGLEALTKVWAKELGAFSIRSVAVAPGFMDTLSTHSAISDDILEGVKKNIPLKKLGTPDCIASTVIFAIENDYISGKVISVDGGLSF